MDLSIADVAELLNVSEETIHSWVVEGKIPSYQIQQIHRFDKMQIEDWLLYHREELIETAQGNQKSGMLQFALYRALNRGNVYYNCKLGSKEAVIAQTVEWIAPGLELDPEVVTELLLDREKLMSTAIGRGVAIPHARECLPKESFCKTKGDLISLVVLETPIPYGALDGQPVDLLFFLFATEDKDHLHLLSKIAYLASDEKMLAKLRARPNKTDLMKEILEWEATLASKTQN